MASLQSSTAKPIKIFEIHSKTKWDKRHDAPNPKKYMLIEKNYMDEENEELVNGKGKKTDVKPKPKPILVSKLSPELQSSMQLILGPGHMASSMAAMRYNANKLPPGKLSKKFSVGVFSPEGARGNSNQLGTGEPKYGKPARQVLSGLTSRYCMWPPRLWDDGPPVVDFEEVLKRIELMEVLWKLGMR